ncbi:tetratricopeptide repeat protein [Leptotrichia trevisanii]|uniref:Tetratricopeptide repeat protein n=1 Tax=Leptotrichia trevisanii TaxID=109328 RepID=A0A510K5M3_9FUSO|nr:hypothetical protein [Leptotrichia trevisanii]BBM46061.1 hypothetical protein JMUB3870_2188 [Leptotrichia trevisanii]
MKERIIGIIYLIVYCLVYLCILIPIVGIIAFVLLILLDLMKVETRYIDILFLLLILSILMPNFLNPVKKVVNLCMDEVVKLYEKVLIKYMNRMNEKYEHGMNFLYEELNPDKFIEFIKRDYKKYDELLNINLSLGYYFKEDIEQSYKFLENIDLSEKSVLDENSKLSINIRKAALLNKIGRKEEAINIYNNLIKKDNFDVEIKNSLENLKMDLYYENDNEKMINHIQTLLQKETRKCFVIDLKFQLAKYKEKAGEVEEARKLYEEVVENGNKLYIVEEAKEKLNKM